MTERKRTIGILSAAMCVLLACVAGLSVAFAEPTNYLELRYPEPQTEAFVGETVRLPDAKPVYSDKVERVYFIVETPSGTRFYPETGKFVPEEVGDYNVIICALGTDGSSYSVSYALSVTKSAKPVMTSAPAMPAAFLDGISYKVPRAEFKDYNVSAPMAAEYKTYYIDSDGHETEVAGKFTPGVAVHGDTVSLKYVATSSVTGESLTAVYEVPVLKAESENSDTGEYEYAFDKMFATQGVSYSYLTANGATFYGRKNFSATYANLLHASASVRFKSVEGADNFGSVLVTICDSVDPTQTVEIRVSKKNGSQSDVSVNGGDPITTAGSISDYARGFGLSLDNKSLRLDNISGEIITTVNTTADGAPFDGFDSGFVKLTLAAENLTADAALAVYYVNGQTMTASRTGDVISPYIETEEEIRMQYAAGDEIVIPRALAFDIIDPDVSSVVNVLLPSGDVAEAKDGTRLWEASADDGYTFVADKLGEYTLQYVAEDRSGNVFDAFYFTIYVSDETPPEINVKSLIKSTVKVGEKVKIPEVEISDDFTPKDKLETLITVSLPKGSYAVVESGEEFTFTATGVYYVRYTVIDSYYNMTTVEQAIVCA